MYCIDRKIVELENTLKILFKIENLTFWRSIEIFIYRVCSKMNVNINFRLLTFGLISNINSHTKNGHKITWVSLGN